MKKVCAVVLVALLVSVQVFAYDLSERMLDPGSFDLSWSSGKDGSQVLGSFSLAEYYRVKPETGYFTCFSPLHLDMAYSPRPGNSNYLQNWQFSKVDLVNLTFGIMRPLGECFRVEPFYTIRALNPTNLKDVDLIVGTEISFIAKNADSAIAGIPCTGKAGTLLAGVDFNLLEPSKINYLLTLKLKISCITQ